MMHEPEHKATKRSSRLSFVVLVVLSVLFVLSFVGTFNLNPRPSQLGAGGGRDRRKDLRPSSRAPNRPGAWIKQEKHCADARQWVPEHHLPDTWSKDDRRGYYAFLHKSLPIYRTYRADIVGKKASFKEAIDVLTGIYDKMSDKDREYYNLDFILPDGHQTLIPRRRINETTDGPLWEEHPARIKFLGEKKVRNKRIELLPYWVKQLMQHENMLEYKLSPRIVNNTVLLDGDGKEIDIAKSKENDYINTEKWINETKEGSIWKMPELPEISFKEAQQIIRYCIKNNKFMLRHVQPKEKREDLILAARKIAQAALSPGAGYLAYKMWGSLRPFEYYHQGGARFY